VSRHPSLADLGLHFHLYINYYLIATKGTLPRLGTGQCGTWVGSIIKVQ